MPHIFKIDPYASRILKKQAKIGDVVYLTANPDLPMTVCVQPFYNAAADRFSMVKTRWLKPDGTFETGEFFPGELSR